MVEYHGKMTNKKLVGKVACELSVRTWGPGEWWVLVSKDGDLRAQARSWAMAVAVAAKRERRRTGEQRGRTPDRTARSAQQFDDDACVPRGAAAGGSHVTGSIS